MNVWEVYTPDRDSPWNEERVAHLHRRAARVATRAEIQRDLKDGPKASIDRLLAGTVAQAPADLERLTRTLVEGAVAANEPTRLKAVWVYRMLYGADPLRERLALLWHNHFATSNLKVNNLEVMQTQNDLLRRHALGRFGSLLTAVVKDPAMMIWLDASSNRKGHPNENLARELLELFTLGVGNYTERDVKESARALTGWGVEDGAFRESAARHDEGEKTILGRSGRWKGDDLVRLALDHPATAQRLARRICEWLLGSTEAKSVASLAEQLGKTNLDIGRAVETVLRSRAFFARSNFRRVILAPTEFVIGTVRALELTDRPPSTLQLAEWLTRMGQDLFYPPNVGGWPGGRAWLASRNLLARVRFAAALCEPSCLGRGQPLDMLGLFKKHGVAASREEQLDFVTRLLTSATPMPEWRKRILAALPEKVTNEETARRIVALVLATPEAQLG